MCWEATMQSNPQDNFLAGFAVSQASSIALELSVLTCKIESWNPVGFLWG